MRYSLQDVAAALVSVIVAASLLVHAFKEVAIPSELHLLIGASITWLYMRSTQAAVMNNEARNDQGATSERRESQ